MLKTGARAAARTVYARALALAPDHAQLHVHLANIDFAERDYVQARVRYEEALALDRNLASAHQGLSYTLVRLGDDERAEYHRALGFAHAALTTAPHHARSDTIDVLLVVAARGGTMYTDAFLADPRFRVTTLVADAYTGTPPLGTYDVVFNAISDADRSPAELAHLAELLADKPWPIVNLPKRVLATGRLETAQTLDGIADLVIPRIALVERGTSPPSDLAYPCLVRSVGFHTGEHFVVAEDARALAAAQATLPGDRHFVMQFVDARSPDGWVRKYRMLFVDGEFLPMHVALSRDWKVHYLTAPMEAHAELRAEDAQFLADPSGVLGPRATRALEAIRDRLALDYAGVDFSLDEHGRVIVFEANATMIVLPPSPDPIWDYRRAPVARIIHQVKQMIATRAHQDLGARRETSGCAHGA